MNSFKLKFAGLTGVDKMTIKSILRQSIKVLNHDWIIIEEGQADLTIFSFETTAGQIEWQHRASGLTALLSQNSNVGEPVDIIIRKPLHKDNLVAALNLAAITKHEAPIRPSAREDEFIHSASFITDLFKRWLSAENDYVQPVPLLLKNPFTPSGRDVHVIRDATLLRQKLHQSSHQSEQSHALFIEQQLIELCTLQLKGEQKIHLLEVYFDTISSLLFTHDASVIDYPLSSEKNNQTTVETITLVLKRLAICYLTIAQKTTSVKQTRQQRNLRLFVINRAAECLTLLILHHYRFYQAVPEGIWKQLHHLYLYQETVGNLHESLDWDTRYTSRPFFEIYCQILLTSLSDPYRLRKYQILQLYSECQTLTDQVQITLLPAQSMRLNQSVTLTGQFCINPDEDNVPESFSRTEPETRQLPSARLLNIHSVLLAIESRSKQFNLQRQGAANSIQLLKSVMPQLMGAYERRSQREQVRTGRITKIIHGIHAIHDTLNQQLSEPLYWYILNANQSGMKAFRPSYDCHPLNIGDFVALYQEQQIQLAYIKWLHIDPMENTTIGLELIHVQSIPILCTPEGEAIQHKALLCHVENNEQPLLITEKGLYSPKRKFRIKQAGEPYLVVATSLIESTDDYEQFNFQRITGS